MLLHEMMYATVHLCAELMTLIFEVIAFRFDLLDTFSDGVSNARNGSGARPMMLLGCPSLVGRSLRRLSLQS
jgi:hypothetical protein